MSRIFARSVVMISWHRINRNWIIVIALLFVASLAIIINEFSKFTELYQIETQMDVERINIVENFKIEAKLLDAMKEDKGSGCQIPNLDPFAKEILQLEPTPQKIQCQGQDWVKCYLSECKVVNEILATTEDVQCYYRDIVYLNDHKYIVNNTSVVKGDNVYILKKSDHVKITCTGKHANRSSLHWRGHATGLRVVEGVSPPVGREKTLNVLILGFDSTSRNSFIRHMPRSYALLQDELEATILKSYNIVGDGTPAAFLPILTGKTEPELPDCSKSTRGSSYVDSMPFIFYKLRDDGYCTAYWEDSPDFGTFQYRFRGFLKQPTDHYLQAFFLEESKRARNNIYCLGDTPQFKIMLNLTDQFFTLNGKRFAFTFIADITHHKNMLAVADDDLVDFLRGFQGQGRLKDTLLIVMSDHGSRFSNMRAKMQGRFEELLPIMAIMLPDDLKKARPEAQQHLNNNAEVLTTPHDIYATILDALDMKQHWNPYKLKGSHYTRGMTLLDTIPHNRSCSEAGIDPYWCACVNWRSVPINDHMYQRTAQALVDYINQLTENIRTQCVLRTLESIASVSRDHNNIRKYDSTASRPIENYLIKITVGPADGTYEALLSHNTKNNTLLTDITKISRTNAYNNDPHCIKETHPHLQKYCYCSNNVPEYSETIYLPSI